LGNFLPLALAAMVCAGSAAGSPFVYVANSNSNTVSVIDVATNILVATVPVGTQPLGVAITPNSAYAYVTNGGGNSVSVIKTASNSVTATISVGTTPLAVAITPNGDYAYVANWGAGSVSVISTASNLVTATVTVGSFPDAVAITPDGTMVYVVNEFFGGVSVIATATNKVVASVLVGSTPQGIAITPDGTTAYVANSASGSVSVIATATNTVTGTVEVGSSPNSVAITPSGAYVYVSNWASNSVAVIATATNELVANVPVGTEPHALAITPDGNYVYVTDAISDAVSVIATGTNTLTSTISVGLYPDGVAITGSTGTPGVITSPSPGSILPSDAANFSWNPVLGATNYLLTIGTTLGGTNVFEGSTAGTSQAVNFMPCTGETLYVSLSAFVGGAFEPANNYTYICGTVISDFLRDGHPDVIWEEPVVGWAQVWYLGGLNGVVFSGAADLTTANSWQIVGIADFNGDGSPDVVWQDPVSGAVQVWFLGGPGGVALLGAADITTNNPWKVVSVADFNQDGHPDLLWQDPETGWAQIWYMGGAQGTTLLGAADLTTSNPWQIVGSGDFNGDGYPDVLWQDPVSGTVQIWYLGGNTAGAQGSMLQYAQNLTGPMTTKVVAVADFNQDGHPDVVFENSTTGAATVYFYTGSQGITPNGTSVLSTGNPWRIAGPH
jgi:YVTN family beta-propeller protein